MASEWFSVIPVAVGSVLLGAIGVSARLHLQKRKRRQLDKLKEDHARLEAAVSELLNRLNEIDLASQYDRKTYAVMSPRVGEICAAAGQLAEAVSTANSLLAESKNKEARQLILSSLSLGLELSDEINRLRSQLPG